MQKPLSILPSSWSCSNSSIQIFGYTNTNTSIFVKFPILAKRDGPEMYKDMFENRYGVIYGIWKSKNLTPYYWININNYKPLPQKYAKCDLNISCGEEDIVQSNETNDHDSEEKLLFWDIETYVENTDIFCSANNPKEYIYMISIITKYKETRKSYLITTCNVPISNDYYVIKVSNEKALLERFFTIYQSFNPDRDIYFNGDSFDMPYLIGRCELNKVAIPTISKLSNYVPGKYITKNAYNQSVWGIDTPGIDRIDLMLICKRLYPHLENHKLDTIAKHFLDKGKLPITLEEMIKAVDTQDPQLLDTLAQYSVIDSLRMVELWEHLDLSYKLYSTCNNLKLSPDDVLHENMDILIDKIMYNMSIDSLDTTQNKPEHLNNIERGIYMNVYIYSYAELYLQVMRSSNHENVRSLAIKLVSEPDELISKIFYSKYINTEELNKKVYDEMQVLKSKYKIIGITGTQIFTQNEILDHEYLQEIKFVDLFLSEKEGNILLQRGKFTSRGYGNLYRFECDYIQNVINYYLVSIRDNIISDNTEELETSNTENLILTRRINNLNDLSPDKIEYKLIAQYDKKYIAGVTLKYIMSMDGPILYSKMTEDIKIDQDFYREAANRKIKYIKTFDVYR